MNLIIITALLGVVLMLAGVFLKNTKSVQLLANVSLIIIMIISIYDYSLAKIEPTTFFNGMIVSNNYIAKLNIIIAFATLAYKFLFHESMAKVGMHQAEYFALILFTLCGIFLITGYNNLLMLFLGLEIMSIPQYILAGADKKNLKSNEASLKYFLMGSFSTGFLLMGIAMLYAACATFDIPTMAQAFINVPNLILAKIGIVFLIVAFGFKASAAPFHIWTPDVYDGTPTAFTPFMASIVKVGVFAAFIKLFHQGLASFSNTWSIPITVIICLTLLVGNITAVYQQSVKRMLAYSSIAQAGFMLFAVYAIGEMSDKGLLLYAATYTLATLGIFAVLIRLKDFTIDGFAGLAKEQPIAAFTATICLLSLAGIPLTGGFFAKYYMLQAAMQNGMHISLLIFAVLMAAVSVYYYFKVIRAMYFTGAKSNGLMEQEIPNWYNALLIVIAIAIVFIGLVPLMATWY